MTGGYGESLERAAEFLRGRVSPGAVGIILGSGLGEVAARIEAADPIPYADVPGLPPCRVPGHLGQLIHGRLGGREVLAFSGRAHLYEGVPVGEVVFGVRLLGALGAGGVVLTTAVGAVRADLAPGDLLLVRDHLNLTGEDPARAQAAAGRFPLFAAMAGVYDEGLAALAREAARERGLRLASGVLAGVRGPSYETPAEVRALGLLGADVVCMSTVLEAMAARQAGIRVLAVAAISNRAGEADLGHQQVLRVVAGAAAGLAGLLDGVLARRWPQPPTAGR